MGLNARRKVHTITSASTEKTYKYANGNSPIAQKNKKNTQMPKPAFHLSADRRNTPATSSQSAFHHSVTTCQLESPSLRRIDIHQLCSCLGHNTTMTKI